MLAREAIRPRSQGDVGLCEQSGLSRSERHEGRQTHPERALKEERQRDEPGAGKENEKE